jgi:hypothetical protein
MRNRLVNWSAWLGLILCVAQLARGDQVSTSSSVGGGTISQSLSLSKRIKEPKEEGSRSVSLSYTLTRNEVGSTTGTSSDTFNLTHSLSGSYSVSDTWKRGITGSFSTTPAENLGYLGASGFLSRTFELGSRTESEDEEEESFIPTFGFKATAGFLRYAQTFQRAATPARKGSQRKRTLTADQAIGRGSADLTLTFDPFEWLGVYGSYTKYFYTRNVSDFMDTLDDPRAIASGAAEFSSTLSGFSAFEAEAGVDFSLPLDFTLSISKSLSPNETTGVFTHSYSVELTKDWGKSWNTGIGADRYVSNGSEQEMYNLSLSYSF